jgi:hypothetical protein
MTVSNAHLHSQLTKDTSPSDRPPTFHHAQFWTALWGFVVTISIGVQLLMSTSLFYWDVPGAGRFHTDPGLETVVSIEGQTLSEPGSHRRIDWHQAPLVLACLLATILGAAGALLLITRAGHFHRLTDQGRFRVVIVAWLSVPTYAAISVVYNVFYLSGG